MEIQTIVRLGRIGSALSAIVIAGCLIKKEQETNAVKSVSESRVVEVHKPATGEAETESVFGPSDALVDEISFVIDGGVVEVSSLSSSDLEAILQKVEKQLQQSETFFSSSKSGMPPVDDERFILYVHKGEQKHKVNYYFLHHRDWNLTLTDIRRFHASTLGTESECTDVSSISYTTGMEAAIEMIGLKNREIRNIVMNIDSARNQQMVHFSSSKALAPPMEEENHQITIVRGGEGKNYQVTYSENEDWEQVRQQIFSCATILSMDYLYEIEPARPLLFPPENP